MTLRLNGSTSGYSEIDAPAVAGDQTFTLPGTGGIIQTVGTSLTLATAQASTSGTSIDFTGIPSWVKRVTVMFSGVSLSGGDDLLVQIGDSGGIETTGYTSRSGDVTNNATSTSGFVIRQQNAANALSGVMTIVLLNPATNGWVSTHGVATNVGTGGGTKELSATLDRIRITRTGTDTFDAGTINILTEG